MLQPRPWRRRMVARDHSETHRQASWLELFFDLTFVIAVAQAARQLEHSLAGGHVGAGLIGYFVVFAAIWWAWMAFTWFANVFDTDDVPYRLLVFVMIAGSLGLAAAVPRIAELDFRVGVISYVVMRLAYVGQWFRVLLTRDAMWRPIAVKMMILTTLNQIGWILFLLVPLDWRLAVFVVWFAADLATPYLAGWDARMGGHRHHIVERYGLFTILVLGESIVGATLAAGEAIGADGDAVQLLLMGLGGLIVVCSVWWIYFDFTTGRAPALGKRSQYLWGYGHYFVFSCVAAIGAGLSLSVEWLTDPGHVLLPEWGVAMLVGAAVALFLLVIVLIESLAERTDHRGGMIAKVGGALLAMAAALLAPVVTVPGSVLIIGSDRKSVV